MITAFSCVTTVIPDRSNARTGSGAGGTSACAVPARRHGDRRHPLHGGQLPAPAFRRNVGRHRCAVPVRTSPAGAARLPEARFQSRLAPVPTAQLQPAPDCRGPDCSQHPPALLPSPYQSQRRCWVAIRAARSSAQQRDLPARLQQRTGCAVTSPELPMPRPGPPLPVPEGPPAGGRPTVYRFRF